MQRRICGAQRRQRAGSGEAPLWYGYTGGRTERDGTGTMEGRGRVEGWETTGKGMKHEGARSEPRPLKDGLGIWFVTLTQLVPPP